MKFVYINHFVTVEQGTICGQLNVTWNVAGRLAGWRDKKENTTNEEKMCSHTSTDFVVCCLSVHAWPLSRDPFTNQMLKLRSLVCVYALRSSWNNNAALKLEEKRKITLTPSVTTNRTRGANCCPSTMELMAFKSIGDKDETEINTLKTKTHPPRRRLPARQVENSERNISTIMITSSFSVLC